jgi:hypothetical protein
LNIAPYATAVEPPESSGQEGRVTRVSRGMLTTVAFVRPSSRWTIIAVSERAPPLLPPPSSLFRLPFRESEPRTRMLSAPLGSGVAETASGPVGIGVVIPLAGRSSPSALSMSTLLMLWFRCQYAHAAPAIETTRTQPSATPAALNSRDRRDR